MKRRGTARSRGGARPSGLALAAGVAVVFGVALGWIALSRRGSSKPEPVQGTMEPPPDVKSAGPGAPLAGGTELLITLVDSKEPTRVEYEITAEKSEPLPSGLYRMTRPRAWRFFRDGRSLLIEAERGQAAISTQKDASRPEQAVLEGGVTVREFNRLEGGRRPIAGVDAPILTIRTNQLRFDGVRNELEFPERFDVEGEGVVFAARGLTAAFNEAARRVEWLRIEKQLAPLVYTPGASARGATRTLPGAGRGPGGGPPAGAGAPGPTPSAPASKPAEAPSKTCYHAGFGGSVLVRRAEGAVESEGAESWMRLEGDSLTPGAIAGVSPRPTPSRAATPVGVLVEAVIAAQPLEGRGSPGASDGPVTVTWTGPMDLRSLAADPAELSRDDVYVKFGTDPSGRARLLDAASGSRADARSMVYAATTRRGWLLGGDGVPATAEQIGTGAIGAPTLAVDLGSGMARATGGAGWLKPSAWESGQGSRGVEWAEQGEFTFAMTPAGEISHLLRADLSGRVAGRDGASSLSGEQMHALFEPGEGSKSRLASLKVIGRVAGSDGSGSAVEGDVLDAAFASAPGESAPKPTRVTLEGHAAASQGESRLSAGRIDAELANDASGRRTVRTVTAGSGVDFRGADGITARCERLEADAFARTAHLTGKDSVIQHPEGSVHGSSLFLHETERTLRVEGEGRLEHQLAPDGDLPAGKVVTTWTRGLAFNDNTGLGTSDGAVVATLTRGEVERDTISAEQVQLGVTPRGKEDAAPRAKRSLISSRASGTPEAPAKVELRRYSVAAGAPSLERLFYLEGATIIGDVPAGTLDVPTPGKALSLDRRRAAERGAAAQPLSIGSTSGRGTALLTWLGTMHVERAQGTVKVTSGVRLVHDRAEGGDRAVLDCQSLTARFREGSPATGSASPGGVAGELLSASAAGGVSLRSAGKTMTAPTLEYDAEKETAEAAGTEGSPVTVSDAAQASPLTAGRMRWDLKSGRIEVLQARPVTGPR